jgi:hypothetical protein
MWSLLGFFSIHDLGVYLIPQSFSYPSVFVQNNYSAGFVLRAPLVTLADVSLS